MNEVKSEVSKRLVAMQANLQAIAKTGNYKATGTGTPFWVFTAKDVSEWPCIIKESKLVEGKEQTLYLVPDMTGIVDGKGEQALAPHIGLSNKFDAFQDMSEYVGQAIPVMVASRKPNPSITSEDLVRMETDFPGSTKNFKEAVRTGQSTFVVVSWDDANLTDA